MTGITVTTGDGRYDVVINPELLAQKAAEIRRDARQGTYDAQEELRKALIPDGAWGDIKGADGAADRNSHSALSYIDGFAAMGVSAEELYFRMRAAVKLAEEAQEATTGIAKNVARHRGPGAGPGTRNP